jgi:hypothetical protein
VSDPVLLALLADAVARPIEHGDAYRVLQLVTVLDDRVLRALDRLDAYSRRQLLLQYLYLRPLGGDAVAQALWRRWLDEPDIDLALMAGPGYSGTNRVIAQRLSTEPDHEKARGLLAMFPLLALERAGAAEALALAPPQLLDQLGSARLGQIVYSVIATWGEQQRHRSCGPPGGVTPRWRSEAAGFPQYLAALEVLRRIPETNPTLFRLLRDAQLDVKTDAELIDIALDIDRAETVRHIVRHPLVWRAAARMIARRPQPLDLVFVEAAGRSSDAETSYYAIDAVDALDGRLPVTALEPLPALRAAAVRARRGDRDALRIVLDATRDPDVLLRAEAVRWLGYLDHDGAHVAVLEDALLDDDLVTGSAFGPKAPVAERAAVALPATARSRTLLLRRFFCTQSGTCMEIILDILCARPLDDSDSRGWSPFTQRGESMEAARWP